MKAHGNARTFNVGCYVCATQITRLTGNPWKRRCPLFQSNRIFFLQCNVNMSYFNSICRFAILWFVSRGVPVWTSEISLYFAWALGVYKCLNLEISEIVKKSILPSPYVKISRKLICLYYQALSSISWFSLLSQSAPLTVDQHYRGWGKSSFMFDI